MAIVQSKQQIEDAKLAYELELRRKKIIFGASVGGTLLFALTIIGLVWGGRFATLLSAYVGTQTGVYADCSKKENRNISYCQAKDTEEDRTWRSMKKGKSAAFTLYGK